MASRSSPQPKPHGLKYLGFIEALAEKANKSAADVYAYAKDSTGPLKPAVHGVETSVKSITEPVRKKLEGKPHGVLRFVDDQVDQAKEKSQHAVDIAWQVPNLGLHFADKLRNGDIIETLRRAIVEEWSFAAWRAFLKVPCVSRAVDFAAPAILFGAWSFNHLVKDLVEMHVPLMGFIPMIPLDKLERALKVKVE